MIRINKYLILFVGFILFLGVSSFVVLQKLLPFARHTSYYCQSLLSSFSVPISQYISAIPLVLFFIFSAVAVIKLCLILIKAQRLKKKLLKKSCTIVPFSTLLEKLHLTDKTYLIESEERFAFCLGIRNPKIYISTTLVSLLNLREVEAVLRHERYHIDNRDTVTMLVASTGESLLPFFPLLSDFLRNFRIEREIKADQEAIRGLGDEKTLIAVLKKLLSTPSIAMISVAAIADEDTLESRILRLMKKETNFKKFTIKHILISVFSAFIMGIIVLSPVQAIEVHHQGEDVIMICPHGNSCINACKQEHATEKEQYSEDLFYSPIK